MTKITPPIFLYKSPLGRLKISLTEQKIIAIDFLSRQDKNKQSIKPNHPLILKCQKQLDEYFLGKRQKFQLPLNLSGTPFQTKVWQQIINIPYGQTISYKQLAKQIKQPKSYRAVANALGKNPIPIIIPCHRIIKSNGQLGGYTGGVKIKQFLLDLEQNQIASRKTQRRLLKK